MKKLLTMLCAMVALVLGISGETWAEEGSAKVKPFNIAIGTQRSPKNTALRISIEDANAKSGVCPYYVRSFEYLPAASLINIEVYQESCLNEAYGVSQGEAVWVAPQGLQNKGSKVSVLVNQTPAGTLIYDQAAQMFSVDGRN